VYVYDMVLVKICGITNPDDARVAVEAGADAIGLVFAESPRRVGPGAAPAIVSSVCPLVTPVGVFVDERVERIVEICRSAGIGVAQLSGDEPAADIPALKKEGIRVIKAVHVTPEGEVNVSECSGADAVLLDTRAEGKMGGTGIAFDASGVEAGRFDIPVIMAGGLTPENVEERILAVAPCAVDVSSGVESAPGKKDRDKVFRFVANAKRAHENSQGT
jgi:phosphoribosylanthranilate isomerase